MYLVELCEKNGLSKAETLDVVNAEIRRLRVVVDLAEVEMVEVRGLLDSQVINIFDENDPLKTKTDARCQQLRQYLDSLKLRLLELEQLSLKI